MNPERLASIYLEQAELLSTSLNEVDAAAESYAKALTCQPQSIVAIDGLIDITRERERFGELAALLQRRIELTADAQQQTLLSNWDRFSRGSYSGPWKLSTIYR